MIAFIPSHFPNPDQTLHSPVASDDGSVIIWPDADETRSSEAESKVLDVGFPFQSLLLFAAGLGIKVLLIQISFLFSPFILPIWLLHRLFLLLNPIQVLLHVVDGAIEKFLWILKGLLERCSSKLYGKLRSQHKLVEKVICGIFCSCYILSVLVAILVIAFVAGSMIMTRVLEKPVMVRKSLNFDYTKSSPDAFVGIGKWDNFPIGMDTEGKMEVMEYESWPLLPPNRKIKLTVSLILPESEYNWKLGVFQVKVELLSQKGQVIDRRSHPCMLQFKSSPIRYLGTLIKSCYLLAGYSQESQTLSLEMADFIEGIEPTTYIHVLLEQRAQQTAGAGIPEIYSASLKLESELPFFKRTIWNWRRTLFIWVSVGFFVLELIVLLALYIPLIILKTKQKSICCKEISLIEHHFRR